jgi:regulator of protease activity HflC (stomatin/prohibitin superfamily)
MLSIETTLRQVVGSRLLQTIITDREGIAAEIQEIVSRLLIAINPA